MEKNHRRTKRPCRICKKWFLPDPRLGDRQKTCGDPECQRKRHATKCAEWNRMNRPYFQEIYLRRRLESLEADPDESLPSPCPSGASEPPPRTYPLDYPRGVVQEVIGAQQLVIIEYFVRLLVRGVQETIRSQLPEIQRKSRRLPRSAVARGDSQRWAPQGSLSP